MRQLNLTHEQQVRLIALYLKNNESMAPGKEYDEVAWLGITPNDQELMMEIFSVMDELIDIENEEKEYNLTQGL